MLSKTYNNPRLCVFLLCLVLALAGLSCKDKSLANPVDPVDPPSRDPSISATYRNETTNGGSAVEINDDVYFKFVAKVGEKNPEGTVFTSFEAYVAKNGISEMPIGIANNLSTTVTYETVKKIDKLSLGDSTLEIKANWSTREPNGTTNSGTASLGTMYVEAEKDYMNIPDSYNITKNNIDALARIMSNGTVIHASGKQFAYEFIVSELTKLVDGIDNETNNELTTVSLIDTKGNTFDHNAGTLSFGRTDGFADTFFTNSEKTMHELAKLYGVK